MLSSRLRDGGYVRRLWLIPLILVLALGYALIDARSGVAQARRLRGDLEAAQARIEALRAKNEALRAEVASLRDDPFARERALREELDLARPGEVVVRMPREESQSPRIP
jgi:cell division protein FtsB